MSTHEKFNVILNKMKELDDLINEHEKLTEEDKIKARCIEQGALNTASELEELATLFTDEDVEEIQNTIEEYEEDIPRLQNELKTLQKLKGESANETLDVMRKLIFALNVVDRCDEAEILSKKIFSLYKEIFTDATYEELKALVDAMQAANELVNELEEDEDERAEILHDEISEIDDDIFNHKDEYELLTPLNAMQALTAALLDINCNELGQEIAKNIYQTACEIYGEESPKTVERLAGYINFLVLNDDLEEAEKYLKEAVRLEIKNRGEEAEETIDAMDSLADVLEGLDRSKEALPIREKVYQLSEKVFGKNDKQTIEAMKDLADTFETLGQYEEANELRSQISEVDDDDDEIFDDENSEDEDDLAFAAIDSLRSLAEIKRKKKIFSSELVIRRTIFMIYLENFGDDDELPVKWTIHCQEILKELAEAFDRLKDAKSLQLVKEELLRLEKILDDYENQSPEDAKRKLFEMIEKHNK